MSQYKLNFHVTENCNFNCKFCFARYEDREISFEEKKQVIENIAKSGLFPEINFAGGEPFLDKGMVELIEFAHFQGLKVSVITNGSLLSDDLLMRVLPYISMLGISFHSFDDRNKCAMGFCDKWEKTLSNQRLEEICRFVETWNLQRKSSCQVKINTVVCRENKDEELLPGIEGLVGVKRWKLLRCQPFEGNKDMLISQEDFKVFCRRNASKTIGQVFEDDMTRSYIMINPAGEFIANPGNGDRYKSVGSALSEPIDLLLRKINLDEDEYRQRYAG